MTAIKTIKLTKIFRKGVRRKCVESLKGLTLEVKQGEIFGFIGANGAGKSTTIKILMGLLKPTHGEAWLLDEPVNDCKSRVRVGYLSEHPVFYGHATPKELLRLFGRIRGLRDSHIKDRSKELLTLLSLDEAGGRPINSLSKGMTQRLGIAAALFHDPELVIMDEPMSGLDPLGRHVVGTLMRTLREAGKTIFFSTHIIPDIENLCDRVGILVGGELKYVGSINEALYPSHANMELTFLLPQLPLPKMEVLSSCPIIWQRDGLVHIEVKESEFPSVTDQIKMAGGKILRLEPQKRSLEDIFLDVTQRSNSKSLQT
jgi:ABC-2 type transport system ATP-binding protein